MNVELKQNLVTFVKNILMKTQTKFWLQVLASSVLGGLIGMAFYSIGGNVLAPVLCGAAAGGLAIYRLRKKSKADNLTVKSK